MNEELFIKTLLIYLSKYGINIIKINELAQKIYPYALQKEFQYCFANINIIPEIRRVLLVNVLLKEEKDGFLKIFDDKIITKYSENDIKNLNINNTDKNLIDKIARELAFRHSFESSNFNIYGLNPNQLYAVSHNGAYTIYLYTDGNVTKISEEIIGKKESKFLYFINRLAGNKRIECSVNDASYVALVGIAPACRIFKLYTETLKAIRLEDLKRNLIQRWNQENLLSDNLVRIRK